MCHPSYKVLVYILCRTHKIVTFYICQIFHYETYLNRSIIWRMRWNSQSQFSLSILIFSHHVVTIEACSDQFVCLRFLGKLLLFLCKKLDATLSLLTKSLINLTQWKYDKIPRVNNLYTSLTDYMNRSSYCFTLSILIGRLAMWKLLHNSSNEPRPSAWLLFGFIWVIAWLVQCTLIAVSCGLLSQRSTLWIRRLLRIASRPVGPPRKLNPEPRSHERSC